MSALNFITDPNFIIVTTDTLSLSYKTKKAYKFLDKAFLFPQMNCIISGTGNFKAILYWVNFIREYTYANGIYQLDLIAQQALQEQMQGQKLDDTITATIYQFGLSEIDNNFHSYAYRSTNNFISEPLEYGLGLKPQDAFDTKEKINDVFSNFDSSSIEATEQSLINIMLQQKAYDDELPSDERLGIGGRIQYLLLTREACISKAIFTFEDFEEDLKTIAENLR